MVDGLTFGNGVISGLICGTLRPRDPRQVSGEVTTRVTLEVVVEGNDVICSIRAQYPRKNYMTDLLTLRLRHCDACI